MNILTRQYMKQLLISLSMSLAMFSTGANAAPGNLANQPLFLSSNVQANIFFATDDSGSMDWETTLNDGTYNPGQVNFNFLPNPPTSAGGLPDDWYREIRRSLCLGFNVLAYNPDSVYTPWKGEDEDGIDYSNKSLTSALFDPYDNDSTRDISNHVYFVWNDADADGQYDGPGSASFGAANNAATDECGDVSADITANTIQVNSLPATLNPGDTGYPNSQQNYANWWTYYRKREYVAKKAMSELIWNSNHRMGLATLHDNNSVGTPISDMTVSTNKDNLLSELGQINSTGGTPLRRLLRNTGR